MSGTLLLQHLGGGGEQLAVAFGGDVKARRDLGDALYHVGGGAGSDFLRTPARPPCDPSIGESRHSARALAMKTTGEVPAAFVVARTPVTQSGRRLTSSPMRVAHGHMRIRHVEIVESIPRTPRRQGVVRRVLREVDPREERRLLSVSRPAAT